MQRFNAYIVWEVTKVFTVALIAFTSMIMMVVLVKELVSQGLGLFAVLEVLPYVLPISLQFSLPATLLFAVCSVYGRISADNEILALMASGVPPATIFKPTLVAAFLLSLTAVWLNEIAVSWGTPGINRVVMHSIEKVVYGWLSSQGSYSTDNGFSIHVHGIGEDGRELLLPTIKIPKANGPPLEISAKSARLKMDPIEEVLLIELEDSEFEAGVLKGVLRGRESFKVQLSDAARKGTRSSSPADYAMRELAAELRKQTEGIQQTQEVLAARTAMALAAGKYDWLEDEMSSQALGDMEGGRNRLTRLHVEPWRRWAIGFMCFFFVWVGIPLSIWMRSADHWTSFGVCFLPILLVFFPVFAVGLNHAKDGSWPPMSVWLGNLVLLLSGSWWIRRVYRS